MDRGSDMCEQSEKQSLILEDNTSTKESKEESELIFPWFLTETIKKSKEAFQSKSKFVKHLPYSFHFQLLIVFSICIVDIVVGSVYLENCWFNRRLCHTLVIQGSFGLFVTLVYTCAIIFK